MSGFSQSRGQSRHSAITSHVENLESRRLLSANLVVNGDFSSGYTGFTSQYIKSNLPTPGEYVLAKNPASVFKGTVSFGDHTTGTGLMLLANGSTTGTDYVWHENVAVAKGATYDFAGFAASFAQIGNDHTDPSPARLSFYVNGALIGTSTVAAVNGKFGRFANLWNSGTSTTASIKIVDRNSAATGNDFALDDLSLTASPNLLVNGDFTSGYVGFSSQYPKGNKTGQYVVAKNPASVYPGTVSFGDHTTGTGLMLLADGATSGSPYIWQESVSVAKNTNFSFSGFAASFGQQGADHTDPNPARLEFYVNGIAIGGYKVNATNAMFGKFTASWNSGNSTNATIKIVDLNHALQGNDTALDDLAFNVQ